MEVEAGYGTLLLHQLRARNAIEASFTGVFTDYQSLLRTNRELQAIFDISETPIHKTYSLFFSYK